MARVYDQYFADATSAKLKSNGISRWAVVLAERRGYRKAVVAIVAKNARMA